MPQYRVTMQEAKPTHPSWDTFQVTVKAVSAKHAMIKASVIYGNGSGRSRPIKARRYNTDHTYWRKLWARAFENMPTRARVQVIKDWVPQEPGATPMPDFIKGLAKQAMRQGLDGTIEKLVTTKHYYRAGRLAALTRLLKYARSNHRSHITVARNIATGAKPRQEWRRKLLHELASKDGTKIALKMLNQNYEPVKLRRP
jgi:hypothetical protein